MNEHLFACLNKTLLILKAFVSVHSVAGQHEYPANTLPGETDSVVQHVYLSPEWDSMNCIVFLPYVTWFSHMLWDSVQPQAETHSEGIPYAQVVMGMLATSYRGHF